MYVLSCAFTSCCSFNACFICNTTVIREDSQRHTEDAEIGMILGELFVQLFMQHYYQTKNKFKNSIYHINNIY